MRPRRTRPCRTRHSSRSWRRERTYEAAHDGPAAAHGDLAHRADVARGHDRRSDDTGITRFRVDGDLTDIGGAADHTARARPGTGECFGGGRWRRVAAELRHGNCAVLAHAAPAAHLRTVR